MSFTAAASGFLVFLLSVPVVQGQDDWGVTYTPTEICALKGSTVDIRCTYRYPAYLDNLTVTAEKALWFTKQEGDEPVDLRTDSEYEGRVEYHGDEKNCSLRITDLRETDSAVYKFRFITNHPTGRFTGSPGVTLTVTTDPDLQVQVSRLSVNHHYTWAELKCHSSCRPAGRPSYVWYNNGTEIEEETSSSYTGYFYPGDSYSCAVKGQEDFHSPSVYSPKIPLVSPSGETVEGSSVNLTCSSDANPAATYTWYKENEDPDHKPLKTGPQLDFVSIQSSDSGEYYCAAENELGAKRSASISINVKYGPKNTSVLVSPSGETVEGSSVTLTCSSDANPAATYTWYKENRTLHQGPEESYSFTSISSEDSRTYHCQSDNQYGQFNSSSLFIDVQYAPKVPSVLVSSSGEIVEGSSVNLTCSSDANPAATYTWYKENEASPKASGQTFTITDIRPEHSGNYYCEAQNRRGRYTSTLQLTVMAGK
ncbi:B-cell receptor CD22-like [Centroberyx gerrardi]